MPHTHPAGASKRRLMATPPRTSMTAFIIKENTDADLHGLTLVKSKSVLICEICG